MLVFCEVTGQGPFGTIPSDHRGKRCSIGETPSTGRSIGTSLLLTGTSEGSIQARGKHSVIDCPVMRGSPHFWDTTNALAHRTCIT